MVMSSRVWSSSSPVSKVSAKMKPRRIAMNSGSVAGTTTGFTWDVAQDLPLLLVEGTTSYVYGPGGLPLERITLIVALPPLSPRS